METSISSSRTWLVNSTLRASAAES
jgi:hypothetical protein